MEEAVKSMMYIIFPIMILDVILKGVALWRAGRNNQRNWFIALLVLNTFGILEIVYLFRFSKKRLTLDEMKSWISRT